MRLTIVVGLLCLVVGAGCMGSPNGGGTLSDSTQHETATPTATTVKTTQPAIPPDATSKNTLYAENMTDRQEEAFLEALDYEINFGPESPHLDTYDKDLYRYVFSKVDYIRYDGEYYRLEFHRNSYAYTQQTYRMIPTTPEPDASVADFEKLPESDQEKVRKAISGIYRSEYRWGPGGPAVFGKSYIRHEGEIYKPKRISIFEEGNIRMRVDKYEVNESVS
jgi:hypothetical protein